MRKKLLVLRFSALGDVAMTIPSLWALSTEYPELDITVLSTPNTESLFKTLPCNVTFKGVNFKKEYKGLLGLHRLATALALYHYDYVADLHDVLRSKYIRNTLKIKGSNVAYIDKGRKEKKGLTKCGYMNHPPLISSFSRYSRVFHKLGFKIDDNKFEHFKLLPLPTSFREKLQSDHYIGVAPFAKHSGKIYPLEKMKNVIHTLSQQPNIHIFLFGFGKNEDEYFQECCTLGANVHNLAGKYKMIDEVAIMQRLDVMLSMDSANMHLASLAGIPVVSIWGATHSHAGFMGWKQSLINTLEIPLPCRPCSVFGDKPCKYGDYRCMSNIKENTIIDKLISILNSSDTQSLSSLDSQYNKLRDWCHDIHEHFELDGEIIYDARNQIRVYEIGESTRINVKRYKVPIFINRLIYTYLRRSKCVRAFVYAKKLKDLGINTPKAISYRIIRKCGLVKHTYLVTEHEDNLRMLHEFGKGGTRGREHIIRALARFVAVMHQQGVLHKDLSCGNILFREDNKECYFTLVDINRMEFCKVDKRKGCANFARLWGDTSFFKMLAEEYALTMGYDKGECTTLILHYRKKFWKNRPNSFSEDVSN